MNFTETFYPESRFGGYTDIDGTMAFYQRVNALLTPDTVVLDAGCGRGAQAEDPIPVRRALRNLRGRVRRVIGLDVDPDAGSNPTVDEFRLIENDSWPVPDASAHLILSDFVLEHLPDPPRFFAEAGRVLRPGGYICLRTPNLWGYTALLARLVPNRLHPVVTSRVQSGREARDVFPTLYRCNTIPKVRSMLRLSGCKQTAVYGYEAEPSYLSFSSLAFGLGVLHQKLTPAALKTTILAYGQKQPG
jgi:SAM-dependent methyltransferase